MHSATKSPSSYDPSVRLAAKLTGMAAAAVVLTFVARQAMQPEAPQSPLLMLVGNQWGQYTANPTLPEMRAVLKDAETAKGGCITVAVPQFISQSGPGKASAYAPLVPDMVRLMGKPGAMTSNIGDFADAAAAIGPAARPMLPAIVKALADPTAQYRAAKIVDDVWKVTGNTAQGRSLLTDVLKGSNPASAAEARKLLGNTPS